MYVATTKNVETMCQNIQWIVSKFGVFVRKARIIILVMFSVKRIVRDVAMAFILVFGAMLGVDRIRIKRR